MKTDTRRDMIVNFLTALPPTDRALLVAIIDAQEKEKKPNAKQS